MSKSLIRKNQLHPDIADLISGYGDDFFITQAELDSTIIEAQSSQGSVLISGNQTISGLKTFYLRPIFNGSGLATTGELGGSTVFSGNRIISAQVAGFQGTQPGGNDVVEFLNNVFFPFISATVNLNPFTIQAYGSNFSTALFNTTLTANSEPIPSITNMRYFLNDIPLVPGFTPIIGNHISGPIPLQTTINSNLNGLNVRVNVNNNGNPIIISGVQTLFLQPRYYYGLSELTSLTASQLTGTLINSSPIFKPSSVTHSFAPIGRYIYFAYPNETKDGITKWGDNLSSIFDLNSNTENLGNFNSPQNATVTYGNGKTMIFRVYRSTLLLTVGADQSFNFRFTFGAS